MSEDLRILIVPPYRGAGYAYEPDQEPYYKAVLADMRDRGEARGLQLQIDAGAVTEHRSDSRDDDVFDHIGVSTLDRIKELAATGEWDAVVVLGSIDIAFYSLRAVAPIPVVHNTFASLHVASLISERFSVLEMTDPQAARIRRLTRGYGFDSKLGSVRALGHSSTELSTLLRLDDPLSDPRMRLVLDDVVEQARRAIEVDRADALIVSFTPLQRLRDEVQARLDREGYDEIPLVWSLSASISTARTLAELHLNAASRSYPRDSLRSKPLYR